MAGEKRMSTKRKTVPENTAENETEIKAECEKKDRAAGKPDNHNHGILRAVVFFAKRETVLCAAAFLAVVSMFLAPPDSAYMGYLDWRVLALLFCLMGVMSGFSNAGLFRWLARRLLARTSTARQLTAVLVFLCFFTSMLITNDVALLTFVPFTIMVLSMAGMQDRLIWVIVLQTIAANLGSMFTPIGNPQNLYLYAVSGMSLPRFLAVMGPYTLAAFLLLMLCLLLEKRRPVSLAMEEETDSLPAARLVRYGLLFGLCLACVARLIPYQILFLLVLAVFLFCDRPLLKQVDYCLLLTFACFFVFIGNMGRVEAVSAVLRELIAGRELWTGVAASQMISNVPAAILLSGFTQNYEPLLIGVNIGGLGTLIASLASLISYKFYAAVAGSEKMRYLGIFTVMNVGFLAVLSILAIF